MFKFIGVQITIPFQVMHIENRDYILNKNKKIEMLESFGTLFSSIVFQIKFFQLEFMNKNAETLLDNLLSRCVKCLLQYQWNNSFNFPYQNWSQPSSRAHSCFYNLAFVSKQRSNTKMFRTNKKQDHWNEVEPKEN